MKEFYTFDVVSDKKQRINPAYIGKNAIIILNKYELMKRELLFMHYEKEKEFL